MQSGEVLWSRASHVTSPFETRLLADSWVLPVVVAGLAATAAVAAYVWAPALWLVALLLGVATILVARLRAATRITINGNELCVTFFQRQPRCMRLRELATITTRPSKANLWMAPALELSARDRQRLTIRLGWWHRESELLLRIAEAAERSQATVDSRAAELLRDRPSAEWWKPGARQAREEATRKPTRLGRAINRLPRPMRWFVQALVFIGQLALYFVAILAIYFLMQLATVFSENVLAPRSIDPVWTTHVAIPAPPGDSWVGNLVTDGTNVHLATRESVQGFWGVLNIRTSRDGGDTWSSPAIVSRGPHPSAARHSLAIGGDGSLSVAWAELGPVPATQQLLLRRSTDGGVSWTEPVRVSPPTVGLVGLPVLLATEEALVVGYTDGETGEIWLQRLSGDGTTMEAPVRLGVTTRQLYSDADFHDGALALTAAGDRLVAAFVEGPEAIRVATSDDGGQTWEHSQGVEQNLYAGRPRLASDGSTVLLAASDPNREARYVNNPFVRIWHSTDGGATFERGPDVTDVADIGDLELVWADGLWRVVYDACPGGLGCATDPRIWYATSADGRSWSEPGVLTDAGPVTTIGLAVGDFGTVAVWANMDRPHEWSFSLARRDD